MTYYFIITFLYFSKYLICYVADKLNCLLFSLFFSYWRQCQKVVLEMCVWHKLSSLPRLQVVSVVEQCQADVQEDQLYRLFNEPKTSDSIVQYLRLLTSARLQNQADFFCNFVEAPNLQIYCRQVSSELMFFIW